MSLPAVGGLFGRMRPDQLFWLLPLVLTFGFLDGIDDYWSRGGRL